ncbi:MAG TPA: hypothetical protein PKL02_05855 [Rectinema sp.]|nr:hypothetical protein [Rectinema sp.]
MSKIQIAHKPVRLFAHENKGLFRNILTLCVFLCFLFLLLFSSCRSREVHAFGWYDKDGQSLAFTSLLIDKNVGIFERQGEKEKYNLIKAIEIPEGYGIRLLVSSLSNETEFLLNFGEERGKSKSIHCSISEAGSYAFVIPLSEIESIKWLEIKVLKLGSNMSEGNINSLKTASKDDSNAAIDGSSDLSLFSVKELRFVPPFRGMRIQNDITEISPHFLYEEQGEKKHYEIMAPFSGLSPELSSRMKVEIILEGSPGLATFFWGNQKISYLHQGKRSLFVIPYTIFENSPGKIAMDVENDIRASVFCVDPLQSAEEPPSIDPGLLVFHSPLIADPYYLARWDQQPEVLLFLFKDYSVQDRYLKRLAFFVEKMGFVGSLAQDSQIASLHGWNAHDYRAEDLARFFDAAATQNFSLSNEEIELRELLIKNGIILKSGGKYRPGIGAVVSISQESPSYLQYRLLTHELSHALFFTDTSYRDLVISLYQRLTNDERWFLDRYFRWMRYNVNSSYLMANEMQAYLVQQPIQDLEKYFSRTLANRLVEEHPELTEDINFYMEEHLDALVSCAEQLGSFLESTYGFEPGMLFRAR